jgi:hypothetical protein
MFICSPYHHVMQGDGVAPGHRTLEWDKEMLSTLDCVRLAKDFNGIVVVKERMGRREDRVLGIDPPFPLPVQVCYEELVRKPFDELRRSYHRF